MGLLDWLIGSISAAGASVTQQVIQNQSPTTSAGQQYVSPPSTSPTPQSPSGNYVGAGAVAIAREILARPPPPPGPPLGAQGQAAMAGQYHGAVAPNIEAGLSAVARGAELAGGILQRGGEEIFTRIPLLSDAYAAGRAAGQDLGINPQEQPRFSPVLQSIIFPQSGSPPLDSRAAAFQQGARVAEDVFTKTPYMSVVTGPFYNTGRSIALQGEVAGLSKDYEAQRLGYIKSGVIASGAPGERETWTGTQLEFANFTEKFNRIGVKSGELEKTSHDLMTGGPNVAGAINFGFNIIRQGGYLTGAIPLLAVGIPIRPQQDVDFIGVSATNVYNASMNVSDWWGDKNNPNAPNTWWKENIGKQLESPQAQQYEKFVSPTNPLMLPFLPVMPAVSVMTPSVLNKAGYGFVTAPGAAAGFAGTVAKGGEFLMKAPVLVFPALVLSGLYMQAKGLKEGLTGETEMETGLSPLSFVTQQAGLMAMIDIGGELTLKGLMASPLRVQDITMPVGKYNLYEEVNINPTTMASLGESRAIEPTAIGTANIQYIRNLRNGAMAIARTVEKLPANKWVQLAGETDRLVIRREVPITRTYSGVVFQNPLEVPLKAYLSQIAYGGTHPLLGISSTETVGAGALGTDVRITWGSKAPIRAFEGYNFGRVSFEPLNISDVGPFNARMRAWTPETSIAARGMQQILQERLYPDSNLISNTMVMRDYAQSVFTKLRVREQFGIETPSSMSRAQFVAATDYIRANKADFRLYGSMAQKMYMSVFGRGSADIDPLVAAPRAALHARELFRLFAEAEDPLATFRETPRMARVLDPVTKMTLLDAATGLPRMESIGVLREAFHSQTGDLIGSLIQEESQLSGMRYTVSNALREHAYDIHPTSGALSGGGWGRFGQIGPFSWWERAGVGGAPAQTMKPTYIMWGKTKLGYGRVEWSDVVTDRSVGGAGRRIKDPYDMSRFTRMMQRELMEPPRFDVFGAWDRVTEYKRSSMFETLEEVAQSQEAFIRNAELSDRKSATILSEIRPVQNPLAEPVIAARAASAAAVVRDAGFMARHPIVTGVVAAAGIATMQGIALPAIAKGAGVAIGAVRISDVWGTVREKVLFEGGAVEGLPELKPGYVRLAHATNAPLDVLSKISEQGIRYESGSMGGIDTTAFKIGDSTNWRTGLKEYISRSEIPTMYGKKVVIFDMKESAYNAALGKTFRANNAQAEGMLYTGRGTVKGAFEISTGKSLLEGTRGADLDMVPDMLKAPWYEEKVSPLEYATTPRLKFETDMAGRVTSVTSKVVDRVVAADRVAARRFATTRVEEGGYYGVEMPKAPRGYRFGISLSNAGYPIAAPTAAYRYPVMPAAESRIRASSYYNNQPRQPSYDVTPYGYTPTPRYHTTIPRYDYPVQTYRYDIPPPPYQPPPPPYQPPPPPYRPPPYTPPYTPPPYTPPPPPYTPPPPPYTPPPPPYTPPPPPPPRTPPPFPPLYPPVNWSPVPVIFKPEEKKKRRKKKRARVSEEWYIWNPVPLLEDIFGHRMGYKVTDPYQYMKIAKTPPPKVVFPKYKMPKMLKF